MLVPICWFKMNKTAKVIQICHNHVVCFFEEDHAAHVDHVNHVDRLNHGGAQLAIGHGDALTQHQLALQEHEARVQVGLLFKLKDVHKQHCILGVSIFLTTRLNG
jgi:hypothetical protein